MSPPLSYPSDMELVPLCDPVQQEPAASVQCVPPSKLIRNSQSGRDCLERDHHRYR